MDQEQQSRWRPTRRQLLWAGGIVVALTVSILIGYRYGITLWDWIKLLIVPAVIAGGGLWFNMQQRQREQQIADARAQDEALQAYLDQMSQLLTDKDQPLHKAQLGDSLSMVARARTLTVLPSLAGSRKGRVLQFLNEARLIRKDAPIFSLSGANLTGVSLQSVNLAAANLSHTDLQGANPPSSEGELIDARIQSMQKTIEFQEQFAQQNRELQILRQSLAKGSDQDVTHDLHFTHIEEKSYLEAPSIGWQLFALDSSQCDRKAFVSSLDTYGTRLLTEALRRE